MYRLYTTFFDTPTHVNRRWVPAMDVVEGEDSYMLALDLPGLKADDVELDVTDGVLTISGERRFEHTSPDGGFVRVERSSGAFARSLPLPDGTDAEAIAASFDDGVLEITIPKPAAAMPKRIEIGVGSKAKAVEAETTAL
jgi:HSP20 family protein